ncbi:MAG: hypothetical protein AAB621_03450 [Patescibacteria group bacterium]
MKNKRNIIFLIIFLIIIVGWLGSLFKKDAYTGFYYPDAGNLFKDIQSESSFDSLDACRNWVNKQKNIYNPNGENSDDYECGKNCKLQNGQKPYICKETLE